MRLLFNGGLEYGGREKTRNKTLLALLGDNGKLDEGDGNEFWSLSPCNELRSCTTRWYLIEQMLKPYNQLRLKRRWPDSLKSAAPQRINHKRRFQFL